MTIEERAYYRVRKALIPFLAKKERQLGKMLVRGFMGILIEMVRTVTGH